MSTSRGAGGALLWCLAAALGAGCDEAPAVGPPLVDVATVKTAFTEVRGCRLSIEHDAVQINVWASPDAAQAYLDGTYPFAPGALVVKAEHDDLGCGELIGWTVMQRLADGAVPDHEDWAWQRLDAAGRVLDAATSRCVSCHLDCTNGRDMTCTDDE